MLIANKLAVCLQFLKINSFSRTFFTPGGYCGMSYADLWHLPSKSILFSEITAKTLLFSLHSM